MTAPMYRSQPTHADSMVVTIREIDGMRDEIASLIRKLHDMRVSRDAWALRAGAAEKALAAAKREASWMTEGLS